MTGTIQLARWHFVALAVIVAVLSSAGAATWTIRAMEQECQAALDARP